MERIDFGTDRFYYRKKWPSQIILKMNNTQSRFSSPSGANEREFRAKPKASSAIVREYTPGSIHPIELIPKYR